MKIYLFVRNKNQTVFVYFKEINFKIELIKNHITENEQFIIYYDGHRCEKANKITCFESTLILEADMVLMLQKKKN